MGVYGCPKCDGGFQSSTIDIDPEEDVCSEHGLVYVVKREPQDIIHTAKEHKS